MFSIPNYILYKEKQKPLISQLQIIEFMKRNKILLRSILQLNRYTYSLNLKK